MEKFATSFALSIAIIALLPACGGTSKKCSPCSKAKQTTEKVESCSPCSKAKQAAYDKEEYSL